jgi:CBS domain-containing protein
MKESTIDPASLKTLQGRHETLKSIEGLPFREDLMSLMVKDVLTCAPEAMVCDTVKQMVSAQVSSIMVVDTEGNLIGVLTEGDIITRIVAKDNRSSSNTRVMDVMSKEIVSLSPTDSVYRAMSTMSTKGIKHLPLLEHHKPVGMVTLRNLLKLRYPEPMSLIESIYGATSIEELAEVRANIGQLAARKLASGIRAYEIVNMISMINQDIHRKTFEMAIQKLGEPPSVCCLFLTGSHGRMENLLYTDQDHGMIIADSPDGVVQYREYYMELTSQFSNWLVQIGYPWCPGYIMSVNPTWRKSLAEWKQQINYWMGAQVTNLVRFTTVLFDSRPIYGNTDLFDEMMDYAFSTLGKHNEAVRMLHDEESGHRVPTKLLGGFITEKSGPYKGYLDIKKSGLIFMVESVRVLALLHGIRETSTIQRITALVKEGKIHPSDGEYFEASYRLLLHFALSAQVQKIERDETINTYIDPREFSPRQKEVIRHAFKSITHLKELISGEFGELIL